MQNFSLLSQLLGTNGACTKFGVTKCRIFSFIPVKNKSEHGLVYFQIAANIIKGTFNDSVLVTSFHLKMIRMSDLQGYYKRMSDLQGYYKRMSDLQGYYKRMSDLQGYL